MTRNHRSIQRILLAGALVASASVSALAEVVTDGYGWRYHLSADAQRAELTYLSTDSTNATAYVGEVTVPETVFYRGSWLPVTGVTALACTECSELTAIVLPEGVTQVGMGAFADCTSLSEVQLPQSLRTMHDLTFYRDSTLHAITLPRALERIASSTFAYCTGLSTVTMPEGLRSVASRAFYYCTQLEEVSLPITVCALGEQAFAYCTSLQQLSLENAPFAVTPDVFEGVDVSTCRLSVPTDLVEAYRAADVWCDFDIVDSGHQSLRDVQADDSPYDAFSYEVHGTELWLKADGDAPALVYDLEGRRIAVAASHGAQVRIPLAHARIYIIRCGRRSTRFTL